MPPDKFDNKLTQKALDDNDKISFKKLDEIKQIINEAVAAAVKNELGDYKIPKEDHYKQHLFLADLMKFANKTRSMVWGFVVRAAVTGIIVLIVFGFIFWGHREFNSIRW